MKLSEMMQEYANSKYPDDWRNLYAQWADEVSRLERIEEKVERFRLADWEFRGGHQPTAWMELCDALKAEEER